jgi:hypothetical protein
LAKLTKQLEMIYNIFFIKKALYCIFPTVVPDPDPPVLALPDPDSQSAEAIPGTDPDPDTKSDTKLNTFYTNSVF